jgi:hypothetical protein
VKENGKIAKNSSPTSRYPRCPQYERVRQG